MSEQPPSDQPPMPSEGSSMPADDGGNASSGPFRDPIQSMPPTARVPERCARGVYSTGQLIHDSAKEFTIDFLHGLTRPYQVVARVVVHPLTMDEFTRAMRINLEAYTRAFGPPPPVPPIKPPDPRPTIEEIYETYKLPDDMLSGQYANQVLIGHSPTEFFLDFITSFYPHPAVSARVYIAAAQAPRFINMLETCLTQYRQRYLPPGT